MAEEKARAHVIVHGKVQGVFYRSETTKTAKNMGVNGWVRNLPDGTVEAVFEGDESAVSGMVEWCKSGSPMANVEKVDVTWEPYEGIHKTFHHR